MWESCEIMQYLCNNHHLNKFYPTDPEKRSMVDSAMFYIVRTLYPYLVRSTYATLKCGRSRRERRHAGGEGEEIGGRGRPRDARRIPRVLF
jgi:glutathione S-transferase